MSKDRFDRAEELRQGILDFLIDHPHSKTIHIADRFTMSVEYAYEAMRVMVEKGEIEAHGKNVSRTWTALKEKTYPASVSRQAVIDGVIEAKRLKKLGVKKAKERKDEILKTSTLACPRYVHRGMDRDEPIKGQGGQGAIRREFGIQASAGML